MNLAFHWLSLIFNDVLIQVIAPSEVWNYLLTRISTNQNFIGSTRLFAGIPVTQTNLESATETICQSASNQVNSTHIHLACASSIYAIEDDAKLWEIFAENSVVLPDGRPFQLLTAFSKKPLSQVRGPSLFPSVIDYGRNFGLKHYFVGTTEQTLAKLVAIFEQKYPGVEIVGSYSPPFRESEQKELDLLDASIRQSGANIVWLGMSTPKQDFEARRINLSTGVMTIAVGAAFDFSAGNQKEAPDWLRVLNLEWLFRFLSEPKRLWRRYLIGNLIFLKAVLRRLPKRYL